MWEAASHLYVPTSVAVPPFLGGTRPLRRFRRGARERSSRPGMSLQGVKRAPWAVLAASDGRRSPRTPAFLRSRTTAIYRAGGRRARRVAFPPVLKRATGLGRPALRIAGRPCSSKIFRSRQEVTLAFCAVGPDSGAITEHRYRVCDICHVKAATVFTTGPSGASLHSWLQ
jgi:hypothetical protein